MKPALKKVLLKKGAKFSALIAKKAGGKVSYKRYVGPCEVLMSATQVRAFKDLLQIAPRVVVAKDAESKDVNETENENSGSPPPIQK